VTTKLAAAAKETISDRFSMSLPPGDRDIGGHHGVARPQRLEELKYFANNTDSCNRCGLGRNFDE
jgi:hypothetical protein